MLSLIKADLYKIVRSKLARVCLILAVAVPFVIVLMYYAVNVVVKSLDDGELGLDLFNARTLIGASFSLSDNVGLVIPIFSAIFVTMDFSNGIVRNKVIAGHTRNQIYLSHLITSIIFNVIIIVIDASVTAGLILMFFDYGVKFDASEAKSLIFQIIIGIFAFVFMATVSTLFAACTQSAAPTIIFTVLLAMILSIIGALFLFIDYSEYKYAVYLIPLFANAQAQLVVGVDTALFIESMISYLLFGGVNVALALFVFNKRDMK